MADAAYDRVGTATRILDIAQHLIQVRGYNAFSYADVAEVLNVTKASLHYHFRSKTRLGEALIERYHADFRTALAGIERAHPTAAARLAAFVEVYVEVVRDGRVCLCFMLATDFETLPASMQDGLRDFFAMTIEWLAETLEAGRAAGEIDLPWPAGEMAHTLVSTLEGAMITCKAHGGVPAYEAVASRVLAMAGVCGADRRN